MQHLPALVVKVVCRHGARILLGGLPLSIAPFLRLHELLTLELQLVHLDDINGRSVRNQRLATAYEALRREAVHHGLLVEPVACGRHRSLFIVSDDCGW